MQRESQILADLRHRVLNRLTWVILALGGAAAAAASAEEIGSGRPGFVLLYGVIYAVAAVFSVSRRVPYWLRAVILLSALFAVGLSELYFFGFPSMAFLYFFAAVTLSGVLLSLRAGIGSLLACLAAILGAAALYALKLVPISSTTQGMSIMLRL